MYIMHTQPVPSQISLGRHEMDEKGVATMNTYTINAPGIGAIGKYANQTDAQAALRYLPYSIRTTATIERS